MNNEKNINDISANNNSPAKDNVQSIIETIQPIENKTQVQANNTQNSVPEQTNIAGPSTQPIVQSNTSELRPEVQIQNQLQNIPTVEQTKEQFINNVQSTQQGQKEEKKETNSLIFIGILFVVVLVSIYFLFPLLDKYI